ncbi:MULTISPECIES: RNA polymerase sigma factor [Acidobacteriaceae]|uniref:RNA polymerase sigma factor n=1 Tax=Acidobacteriaceae TaxID=204434 RepID=UPI00131C4DB9|nr:MULTISPECIES: RNA polymerase sigma factor [Acidobacteriaceae]MDW5264646.1 RNA polymerase sigma factor [Edaphobacter sp.]
MEKIEILEVSKTLTDEEVIDRVRAGDLAMYEVIMRRYNQRLYRIARAILHDDGEAEDVMQDAYVRAYTHLEQFAGRSAFSTWLSRIAVHEALTRLRSRNRHPQVDVTDYDGEISMKTPSNLLDPEMNASTDQLREFLEEAVLNLPENYRTVIMLRDIEELSTAETAQALDLTEENVKIRLHRGHGMMRNWLFERVGPAAKEAFPFMGVRCDRVVQKVFDRLTKLADAHP